MTPRRRKSLAARRRRYKQVVRCPHGRPMAHLCPHCICIPCVLTSNDRYTMIATTTDTIFITR